MIPSLKNYEIWFVTGSQHLYGDETLKQVAKDSNEIAKYLGASKCIPCKVTFKPTVKRPDEIYNFCVEANTNIQIVLD